MSAVMNCWTRFESQEWDALARVEVPGGRPVVELSYRNHILTTIRQIPTFEDAVRVARVALGSVGVEIGPPTEPPAKRGEARAAWEARPRVLRVVHVGACCAVYGCEAEPVARDPSAPIGVYYLCAGHLARQGLTLAT